MWLGISLNSFGEEPSNEKFEVLSIHCNIITEFKLNIIHFIQILSTNYDLAFFNSCLNKHKTEIVELNT